MEKMKQKRKRDIRKTRKNKKKEIKENSWQIMRLCNKFIESKEKNWEKDRKGREIERQAQLGVPHLRIQVELGFILQI